MSTATDLSGHAPLEHAEPLDATRVVHRIGAVGLAGLPGALTVYLSFNAGGYFAGATAVVVAVLAGVIGLRMALLSDPFAGFSRPLLVAIAMLGFYSLWTLLSSRWSHAPARSLLEFDLVNVYLFTLILFGSAHRSHRRVRGTVIATWLAMLGVCVVSLATRLRPDLFPIPANLSPNRLAFPLTYWNALGMFAVVGLSLAFYLASSTRETPVLRVLATAVTPIFAVTILLTFSRAALVLGGASLVVYALLARPRGLLGALLAGAPTSAFAVIETYQAPLIANADTSSLAVLEGKHLTTTLVIACLAAGLGRYVLIELDTRLARLRITSTARANSLILLGFACMAVALFAIFGLGGTISDQWREFTSGDNPVGVRDVRARIDAFSIASRLPGWRIAVAEFDRHPLDGRGADTFPLDYVQLRSQSANALETHSLYLQAMAELGVVGLVAIVATLLVLIGACFMRAKRSARSLWIALGVVAAAWAVHAGLDWDWQMPAVTLPVFALAACGLSRRERGARLGQRTELGLRVLVGALAFGAFITAIHIAASDRDLNASIHAFTGGNCQTAVRDAQGSIASLGSRPQPYAIVGYCEVVSGDASDGVAELEDAVARDPQNWRYQYGLAVARAAAGLDPHGPLGLAERLDPYEPMVRTAAVRLAGQTPHSWQLGAAGLPMPVSLQE